MICQYCGNIHQGICPRLKSVEYFDNGTIKKVEFHEYPYPLPRVTYEVPKPIVVVEEIPGMTNGKGN